MSDTIRFLVPFLVLTPLLLFCAPQGSPPKAVEPTVTVGSWNLEWLGTPERRRDGDGDFLPLRKGPQIERIAAAITEMIDYEVVVLVEINVESRQWGALKGALAQEGFEFVEGSGNDQRVVIGWDTDEAQLDQSVEPELATHFQRADRFGSGRCEAGGKRPLFAQLTAGRFTFTLVGVHLKSMRQPDGCDDPTFTSWVRARQVGELAAELERRIEFGPSVILAGDYNALPDDPALERVGDSGFVLLSDERHRSPASGPLSYRRGPFLSQIDHLAVRGPALDWWIAGSTLLLPAFSTMSDEEMDRWRRTYSDHAPVWAEFRRE